MLFKAKTLSLREREISVLETTTGFPRKTLSLIVLHRQLKPLMRIWKIKVVIRLYGRHTNKNMSSFQLQRLSEGQQERF